MVTLRASYPNNNTIITSGSIVQDLDVLEADQAIILEISAVENGDIGGIFGISSQTFSFQELILTIGSLVICLT